MHLLEIKNLSFQIGGKTIFDGLNLALEPREIHALIGTNGSGKSSLAYLILGCEEYAPTSGEIIFEGNSISALKLHERARLGITLCWQEPARLEGISVENYLTLGRQPVDGATYLRKVGLAPDQYLLRNIDKTLSGGQRKRIELASVLALRPKLALLDEPDSGIDLLSLGEIAEVIHSFKDVGASSLLITHREEIVRIADRASQLCGGKIVLTATPVEVAEHYRSRRCTVCDGKECHYA
ncbi:MAG TPA: ABC transporter ATP-binding protein [Candidatus Binatia bacterium]|jgi:Fe-S cluster assembly ATP-binding protein